MYKIQSRSVKSIPGAVGPGRLLITPQRPPRSLNGPDGSHGPDGPTTPTASMAPEGPRLPFYGPDGSHYKNEQFFRNLFQKFDLNKF